jgi:hypothetical protein
MTDPARTKITVAAWKKLHKEVKADKRTEESLRVYWTPGRIHTDATRIMVKVFLQEFWAAWRKMEGLPVTLPYREAKLGQPPHGQEAAE